MLLANVKSNQLRSTRVLHNEKFEIICLIVRGRSLPNLKNDIGTTYNTM